MDSTEDYHKKQNELFDLYSKAKDTPVEYEWPDYVRNKKDIDGEVVINSIHHAMKALSCLQMTSEGGGGRHKPDIQFVLPFSILHSLYVYHFKKYLPDEEVPTLEDLVAFRIVPCDGDLHEEPEGCH
ncbi:hypothetical protein UFOVP270_12 [uncultured Caudovirales phage]|uniref:Uncharacterized protein n=1 Tax=uncultured Caudovirales phage TaxID=2100421 RepID=A0A6J5L4I4_9CAUD|nr:hypothetical protein UFOVP101_44 [uncultured Caudovirales phage]CAB4134065.1 hypothetical protein UFOVP270_12 [uncultured Caudovirales phage]